MIILIIGLIVNVISIYICMDMLIHSDKKYAVANACLLSSATFSFQVTLRCILYLLGGI